VTEKVVGIVVTEVLVRAAGAVSIEQFADVAQPLVRGGPGRHLVRIRSQVDGCDHVQRVGVLDSPSVGIPNALTGLTSYTSNGAPPEVGAP
jgi:hypothetical protein